MTIFEWNGQYDTSFFQKKNPAVIHDFCTTNFPIKNQVNSWIGKFITVRPMDPKNGCDLQVNHNVYSYSAVIAACHKGYQWFLGNVPTCLAAFFFKGAIWSWYLIIHSWWGGANPQVSKHILVLVGMVTVVLFCQKTLKELEEWKCWKD